MTGSPRWALCAIGALLLGCPAKPGAEVASAPVARLGDRVITTGDLLGVLQGLAHQGELPRDDGFAALRRRTLDERIVEEVLLAEAAARKVAVPPAAVDAEIAALLGDPPNSEIQADAAALHGGMVGWRAVVARRATLNLMEQALRDELTVGTAVTPEQVEGALSRYADRLGKPGRLRARQLFDPDPEVVRALHQRLVAGESFEALAEELGLESGGELGSMSLASAPTLLVQATGDLVPGEHTEVLRSPLGYHVFQLVARTPETTRTPEEAAALVEQWLVEESVESRLRAWIAAKTEALGLEIDEDARDAVWCCRDGRPYVRREEAR
jgi:peptidyl-prolyl cis-trans isomerase C